MSSSEPARAFLRVQAAGAFDELTVVDGAFRPVATGTGSLAAELAPGIYELMARAGPLSARRLVRLEPGEERNEVAPGVQLPATPPISGTAAGDDDHLALVRSETSALHGAGTGVEATLCVVLRRAGGSGRPALEGAGVGLLDASLHALDVLGAGWRESADRRAAVRAVAASPGGYALRLGDGPAAVDQSLWLAQGWTTVVFLAVGDRGIEPASASIHIVAGASGWTGGADAMAAELALWGLREGRWQAGEAVTDGLARGAAGATPTLEIAAAHLLLESPGVEASRIATLVDGLAARLPDHPDVVALQVAAGERGVRLATAPRLPVSWPPTLLASYHALLRRDAMTGDALVGGSVAERAAASVSVRSIWTTWIPISPADRMPPRLARTSVAPERVLERAARHPAKLRRPKTSDPATRRVAAYLEAVAELEDGKHRPGVARLSAAEIALATGLPTATVDRSLRRIWLTFAGLSVLPFVFTLTMLVGVLAVASFGLLNLGMGASATFPPVGSMLPTATPTAEPTEPPTPEPLPGVEVLPAELAPVPLGVSTRSELAIQNSGEAPLTISSLGIDGDPSGEFGIEPGDCLEQAIDPGRLCVALVTFTPSSVGDRRAEVTIDTNELGVVTVPLSGTGIRPELVFEPPTVTLGSRAEASMLATGTITIMDMRLAGESPDDFVLVTECIGARLGPGDRCPVVIIYEPNEEGAHAAVLEVFTDDGSTWTLPITGELVIF